MRRRLGQQISVAAAFPELEMSNFPRLAPVAVGEPAGSRCQGIPAAASQGKQNSLQPQLCRAGEAPPGVSTPRYL